MNACACAGVRDTVAGHKGGRTGLARSRFGWRETKKNNVLVCSFFWFTPFFDGRNFLSFAREIYFGPVAVALDRALPV